MSKDYLQFNLAEVRAFSKDESCARVLYAEIERLRGELAAARSERDLAITRVASILWSGAIDKHTCGDVQKWAEDYTAELAHLRAEVKRWQAEAEEMSAQRSHNANQAGILRAEVERLTVACNNFSNAEIAEGDWKARAERAEAESDALRAAMKP